MRRALKSTEENAAKYASVYVMLCLSRHVNSSRPHLDPVAAACFFAVL